MFEKIIRVDAKEDYQLIAEFENGEKRRYDVRPLFQKMEAFKELETDSALFYKVTPVSIGSGIAWNERIDLASEEIWENGEYLKDTH